MRLYDLASRESVGIVRVRVSPIPRIMKNIINEQTRGSVQYRCGFAGIIHTRTNNAIVLCQRLLQVDRAASAKHLHNVKQKKPAPRTFVGRVYYIYFCFDCIVLNPAANPLQ